MKALSDRSIAPSGSIDRAKLRRQIEVPTRPILWGQRHPYFVPRLLNKVYGDGRRLMFVEAISSRPRYIVVCVDSKTETLGEEYGDRYLIDDIMDEAESQWGLCHCEECDPDEPEERRFPVIHWNDGAAWGGYCWPKQRIGARRRRKADRRD